MDKNAFAGKIVLIFGGTTGIGLSCAIRFATHGAKLVFVVGRDEWKWTNYGLPTATNQGVEDKIIYIQGDIRIKGIPDEIIFNINDNYGTIDIFHNNAGIGNGRHPLQGNPSVGVGGDGALFNDDIARDVQYRQPNNLVLEQPYFGYSSGSDYVEDVIVTNILGTLGCLNAEFKYIRDVMNGAIDKHISIINTASEVAARPNDNIPIYSSTKAAVISLTVTATEQAARFFGPRHGYPTVRVNAVAPGPIFTAIMLNSLYDTKEAIFSHLNDQQDLDTINRIIGPIIPLGRIGKADEVANVVTFLAHQELASFVNGATYAVDGGSTIASPGVNFLK